MDGVASSGEARFKRVPAGLRSLPSVLRHSALKFHSRECGRDSRQGLSGLRRGRIFVALLVPADHPGSLADAGVDVAWVQDVK